MLLVPLFVLLAIHKLVILSGNQVTFNSMFPLDKSVRLLAPEQVQFAEHNGIRDL
jgi:hypothetical protein